MIFTSPRFLVFLAVVLFVIAILPGTTLRKRFLALASCFFYAAWDWRYLGLLLFVSVIDYICAIRIQRNEVASRRKGWLILSVVSNLGLLAYFKYCNFFIENFNHLLALCGLHLSHMNILLPAGISFYTFKTMSYTIDVYRKELTPCYSWLDYATFITFFPELIAGPIVRGAIFLPQMQRKIGPTLQRMNDGVALFMQGLVKKLLIADQMAVIADKIFLEPQVFSCGTIWCGVLAYAIQIYCDFSGYSDMAIGIARMIGYDLPENFKMPYASVSITEFWRRWHITLSLWLRDYLYIPLGGNRSGVKRTYINLTLTMLLGGLWHGANWNFVIWGGIHGVALAVHKLWLKGSKWRVPNGPAWIITFFLVVFAWVPFRASSMEACFTIFRKMAFLDLGNGLIWSPTWLFWLGGILVAAHIIGLNVERESSKPGTHAWLQYLLNFFGVSIATHHITGIYLIPNRITVAGIYFMAVVAIMVFYFAPLNTSPFIYFQF